VSILSPILSHQRLNGIIREYWNFRFTRDAVITSNTLGTGTIKGQSSNDSMTAYNRRSHMRKVLRLAVLTWCACWSVVLAQDPAVVPRAGTAGVVQPRVVRQVAPIFPPIAASARVQGSVSLDITIDPAGRVSLARVTRSVTLLDDAALVAVRQWEFEPTLIAGRPTSVATTVVLNFRLADASAPAAPQGTAATRSGMPPDFAVTYQNECLPALRGPGHVIVVYPVSRVTLTTGTHDLEDVYREMSAAGLLVQRNDLFSWRESEPPEVLGDRIQLEVLQDAPAACARISTSTPFAIHVRTAGAWTRLWPPRQETSRTPEYEQQMREISELLRNTAVTANRAR
jgi:TonB family protein